MAHPASDPPHERRPSILPFPVELTLVTVVYFLAGKLGLSLAYGNTSASAVWPATGIALAALLVGGRRLWPSVFIGAFLVNVTTAGTVLTSLGIAAGNTLEAVLGALAVRRFANGVQAFDRAGDTLRFVLVALGAAMVSATVGLTTLYLGGLAPGPDLGSMWLTWWLGDSGGALIIAPALILWSHERSVRWTRTQVMEGSALLFAVAVVAQIVFGWLWPVSDLWSSLKFLCMPVLIWATLRFDQPIAVTLVVLISALALVGFLRDEPPTMGWTRNQSLMLLQVFMAITAITTLALAAVVAERKRAAHSARQTLVNLREAMAELEAFNHSLAHDLRSPLGAILQYADILEEDFRQTLGIQGRLHLERIRSSGRRIRLVLDQLTQFARVAREVSGKSRVDMTSIARAAYAEVQTGVQMKPGLEFQLPDLPPGHGNAELLVRVFSNLLDNAAKFTRPRESPRVEVGGREGEAENTYFVADNGIGFDPQFGELVFQPFRRAGADSQLEGSGLGLAIVAKIVRNHGGRVWAESDGATGARFYFTLPNAETTH